MKQELTAWCSKEKSSSADQKSLHAIEDVAPNQFKGSGGAA